MKVSARKRTLVNVIDILILQITGPLKKCVINLSYNSQET